MTDTARPQRPTYVTFEEARQKVDHIEALLADGDVGAAREEADDLGFAILTAIKDNTNEALPRRLAAQGVRAHRVAYAAPLNA